jgi:hypothetical protein
MPLAGGGSAPLIALAAGFFWSPEKSLTRGDPNPNRLAVGEGLKLSTRGRFGSVYKHWIKASGGGCYLRGYVWEAEGT